MTKQALSYAEIRSQNYDTFGDNQSECSTEASEQSEIQTRKQIGTQTENDRLTQWYQDRISESRDFGPEIVCFVICVIIVVIFAILAVTTPHT